MGEVQKPGNYPYVTDMTVLNAVAMAGGYTYRARQNQLYIKRLDERRPDGSRRSNARNQDPAGRHRRDQGTVLLD